MKQCTICSYTPPYLAITCWFLCIKMKVRNTFAWYDVRWKWGGGRGGGVPRRERCENIFSPSEKRVRKMPPHRTGALPIETSGYMYRERESIGIISTTRSESHNCLYFPPLRDNEISRLNGQCHEIFYFKFFHDPFPQNRWLLLLYRYRKLPLLLMAKDRRCPWYFHVFCMIQFSRKN